MELKLEAGWSYCTQQIIEIEPWLPEGDTIKVLELGAGSSTPLLYDYYENKYDNLKYVCYENNRDYKVVHKDIILRLYEDIDKVNLGDEIYDIVFVDGPVGQDRAKWYAKLVGCTAKGTIIHIDDCDHFYPLFIKALDKHFTYNVLIENRIDPQAKGSLPPCWLTVEVT